MNINLKSMVLGFATAIAIASPASSLAQITLDPSRQAVSNYRGARNVFPQAHNVTPGTSLQVSSHKNVPIKALAKANKSLPTLYGSVIYSDAWAYLETGSTIPYGCYGFQPADVITVEAMYTDPELNINGGGCYTDRQIHYRLYFLDSENTAFYNYYTVVNTDYWTYVVEPILTQTDNTVADDMTYDRVTGKIYASVWGNFDGTYSRFAEVDPLTGETTELSTIPEMAAITANNFGEIYGVAMKSGILYKISNDGEIVEVGATGLNPIYAQSATVDPATNTIYWAASTQQGSGLYTIDTSTGKAIHLGDFANNEEITCLFIEDKVMGLNAPAQLENFSIKNNTSNAEISFALPDNAFDGSALSGTLEVHVFADGVEKVNTTGTPGQALNYTLELGDGSHTIVAYAQNSVGHGPKTTRPIFSGYDLPGAVTNLHLTIENGKATLSWNAPHEGMTGGLVDATTLNYNIVRYPGGNVCATGHTGTTFTENLPAGIANYYYTVTSVNAQGEGATATSNSVFTGNSFDVPYTNSFDSAESLLGFTIIDGDKDGYTWEYKHLTPYGQDAQDMVWTRYNATQQCNDWLILPPINFKKGVNYKLNFKARVFDSDSPERFEVKMGNAASADAQTITLLPSQSIADESFNTYGVAFDVKNDGTAYLSFHCISSANSYRLIIDDIEITASSADVPAPVTNLTATPDRNGLSKVVLKFHTPSRTASGEVLQSISSISIYNGESITPVATINTPPVDYDYTWTDRSAPQGYVTYRVVCENAAGVSEDAYVTTFVGLDTPGEVTNLNVINDNENAVISWSAPTTTINGQPINTAILTYKVTRNDGVVVAEKLTETTYTDIYYSDAPAQIMCYYQVQAVYSNGLEGSAAVSNAVIFGPDFTLPFKEGFPYDSEVQGHVFENLPWVLSRITKHTTTHWQPSRRGIYPEATASDNDGGIVTFLSFNLSAGDTERLSSGRIDLSYAQYPQLTFDLYRTTYDAAETVTVEIGHNDGKFETLATFPIKGTKEGWETMTVDLPRRHWLPQTQIAFTATTARGYNIHMDNIRINNTEAPIYNCDLEAYDLEVPALVPGQPANIVMRACNNGLQAVTDYKVTLLVNGVKAITKEYNSAETAIEAGEEMEYHFTITPEDSDLYSTFRFQGLIETSGDENPDNNYSLERVARVELSGIDAVEADDAETEYYDVMGQRILNPTPGHFYIQRRGNTVTKTIMK